MSFPYGFTANDLLERFSEERLIEITDVTNDPPATRDDVAIERAAIDAAGELDKHAGRYYVTPIAPLPSWLRTELLDLWAWRLLFNVRPDWLEMEKAKDGYSWADRRRELLKWLTGLSSPKRESVLPGCTELSARTSSSGVWSKGGTAVMTKDVLWRVP